MILPKKEGVKEIMTAAEAADFLSIHVKTLYRLIAERKIPFILKPGLGYRFFRSRLVKWLEDDLNNPTEWKNLL